MADSEASHGTSDLGSDGKKREGGEAAGSSGIEETSPDLLRNTPSNIARLEDVIEHSKGRQKYLAQTGSPSDGSDVRWYFCKVPLAENELAASVPRAEVVGKSEYFRFGMRDSLAIEASFLQREEELLSEWWKEFAECSDGPRARISASSSKGSAAKADEPTELYAIAEERVGVPVKGGLYEVDLIRRHCFPVYWHGENRRVLRGHWFARKGGLDWLPLREDVAEQLEFAYRCQVWHRRTFQPSGLFAARVDLQGSTPGLHALFTGEDNTWEAWLNVDSSGFSSVVGLSGNGIKLRRGYSPSQSPKPTQEELRQQKEEEMDDYCSQVPVRHVVFMVHGIGQRLEKSNLVDDVTNFRHITASLAERHLTSYQCGAQRVLFIPCQWRRGLKLSGEAAVDEITLEGVRGLRVMLSATVHDVLYYMSPIYCQDIIDSVSNQLNRLYLKFLKRNPGYDGKVSIYGHSLGSVLSYDILCHQDNLSSPSPMDRVYQQPKDHIDSAVNNEKALACSLTNSEGRNVHETEPSADSEESTVVTPSASREEKEPAEYSSSVEPSTSGLDDSSVIPSNQVNGDLCDPMDMLSREGNGLHEATSMSYTVSDVTSGAVAAEESEKPREKEKEIDSLKKEIELLKAKVAELESPSHGRDTDAVSHPGIEWYNLVQFSASPMSSKLLFATGTGAKENCMTNESGTSKSYTPLIKYTKLEFKVDTFFAVGSPLGVFLALRNIRIGIGKGRDYWDEENIIEEMPACRQMFNIFHPFDPVAYRVEPLVCKEYIGKRPVIIPYHKGGKRLHIGFQEFTEDLAARSQAIMDNLSNFRAKVLTVCQSKNRESLEEAAQDGEDKYERSYGSLMIERLTGSEDGRIDHVLQDKTFEHPYISAIGSHTNYWRDFDTALFILKHLYRDIPEDPSCLFLEPPSGAVTHKNGAGWSDRRGDAAEEELPLTFSDKVLVRSFSSKAKTFMKSASFRA
ncbi:phospholipase SGR2 isoform X2 [Punica granatum]|uniref:Phospholipase SGR2 isoform X2 n=1 Tax=Punica granatum TaxID=22663 RepID=A0A6P8D5M2_PUNGR|nr:phospholipase SGR2 isoform X2 [Punica granatum]